MHRLKSKMLNVLSASWSNMRLRLLAREHSLLLPSETPSPDKKWAMHSSSRLASMRKRVGLQ